MQFNTEGIPQKKIKELYRTMLLIRKFEEKIIELYPEQEIRCPSHLYIGEEAIATGVCANLKRDDYVFSTHRGHGHYIAKGGDIKAMMAELYGKSTGCSRGLGGSMHIVAEEVNFPVTTAIVCGGIPMAVGASLAISMDKKDAVSVVFFGDGAVDEGVFYESLNFASLKRLPVIFVCENNFYATHSHQSKRQVADNIYKKAEVFLMPGGRIDGNNVLDVYKTAREYVKRARKGLGPSLIECRTYRCMEHAGPNFDFDLGYRDKKELDEWTSKCPVENYEKFLLEKNILSESQIKKIKMEIENQLEDAVKFAKESPFSGKDELENYIYKRS